MRSVCDSVSSRGVTVHKHDGSVLYLSFDGFGTAGGKKTYLKKLNNGLLNKLLFL